MDGGFIVLAFGFCVSTMTAYGAQDTVQLGYISDHKCIIKMETGDSGSERAVIGEHDVGIEILEGGAVIHIDNLSFTIPITEDL